MPEGTPLGNEIDRLRAEVAQLKRAVEVRENHEYALRVEDLEQEMNQTYFQSLIRENHEYALRVEDLEQENQHLRIRVEELTKELTDEEHKVNRLLKGEPYWCCSAEFGEHTTGCPNAKNYRAMATDARSIMQKAKTDTLETHIADNKGDD